MYQIIYIFYFLLYKCTSKQTENIKKNYKKKKLNFNEKQIQLPSQTHAGLSIVLCSGQNS
jgi:hypothetical protein